MGRGKKKKKERKKRVRGSEGEKAERGVNNRDAQLLASAKDFPQIRTRTLDYSVVEFEKPLVAFIYIYIRRFVIKINGSCRSRLSDP